MWRRAGVAPRRAGRPSASRRSRGPRSRCRRRPVGDVHERRVGERRGQEAELHRAGTSWPATPAVVTDGAAAPRSTSTQRPAAALAAIASLTSISSWPSANVAYGGRRGRAARERRRRRSPGTAPRTCRRSPRRGRPGSAAAARPAAPISAGLRRSDLVRAGRGGRARGGRASPSPTPRRRRSRRSPTGASSCGRR